MSSYVTRNSPGDTSWLTHDRFGMFIHFGLYALPARHEWVKSTECIPEDKYDVYFKHFNPDLLDAKEWAKAAKKAGMKYAILTTKHHEGFCLFDSQYTDYKITNTPFGRDLVKEYVDAFRAEGLKVGFYYSLLDWHHRDFSVDRFHPRRNDADAEEWSKSCDMTRYAEYMRNQVRELLTNYGKIDILWFDFSYSTADPSKDLPWMLNKGKDQWESEKLIEMIRSIQPDIVINDRLEIPQDVKTPEQRQLLEWPRDRETGERVVWEACHTFSGSWGYHRDEQTWKSPKTLIDLLVNTVSLGGNLLMNVGPTARGYFDHRAVDALGVYEHWMKYNSRSIYGCTMAEPEFLEVAPQGTRLTQSEDGKRLYIHLVEYPLNYLEMHNMAGKIEYAQFLHDGSEVRFSEGRINYHGYIHLEELDLVVFNIPAVKPNMEVPVIELILK